MKTYQSSLPTTGAPMIRDILHVASPSMRPPWSKPQHKPMTADETAALMLALAEDGQPLHYRNRPRRARRRPVGGPQQPQAPRRARPSRLQRLAHYRERPNRGRACPAQSPRAGRRLYHGGTDLMSITILTGICRGGPMEGHRYTQLTIPARSGRFNFVGLGDVSDPAWHGSYTWGIEIDHVKDTSTSAWRWGPWIAEPEKTEP